MRKKFSQFTQTKLILNAPGIAHESKVEVSVIVPVYNQENIISEVLLKVVNSMQSVLELIIIDDASKDSTPNKLQQVTAEILQKPNVVSVKIYRNPFPRFEVYCDSYGVSKSQGKYCLEVQADILLDDPGFDLKLIQAIESNHKLVMLSGRGVETLNPIINFYRSTLGTDTALANSVPKHLFIKLKKTFRAVLKLNRIKKEAHQISMKQFSSPKIYEAKTDEEFLKAGMEGRSGEALGYPLKKNFARDIVYVGQTVMRGPLFFKTELFKKIGTFDTNRYFQGFDDHDFCARAMSSGYLVGYYPVNFISPLHLGTTRKKRSFVTEILILLNIFRIRSDNANSELNNSEISNLIKTSKNQIIHLR